jgi:hypothetical protein
MADDYEADSSDRAEEEEGQKAFVHWPREPRLDDAKSALQRIFTQRPEAVFYGRQLEVWLEDDYFHWITHKALGELTRDGAVKSALDETAGGNKIRLYWANKNRYWKRAAKKLLDLVNEHSNPELTKALGQHAETMFGLALAGQGFTIEGRNTRSHSGRIWSATENDLDWIVSKDSKAYGVEIKNTWAYIGREELNVKIQLCKELGIAPLFIMRNAAKSYVHEIQQRGGFALLFKTQLFPFGSAAHMAKARSLGLPVDCPTAIPEGTIRRFTEWHRRR